MINEIGYAAAFIGSAILLLRLCAGRSSPEKGKSSVAGGIVVSHYVNHFTAGSGPWLIYLSGFSPLARIAVATVSVKMERTKPELKDFTIAAISQFTGEAGRPIYVAADGIVFNMSSHEGGPAFYGPGGGYNGFAGRDSTVGLATMETDPAKWTKKSISELSFSEKDTLSDWVQRFSLKYDVVGYLNDGAHPRTVAGEAGKQ